MRDRAEARPVAPVPRILSRLTSTAGEPVRLSTPDADLNNSVTVSQRYTGDC